MMACRYCASVTLTLFNKVCTCALKKEFNFNVMVDVTVVSRRMGWWVVRSNVTVVVVGSDCCFWDSGDGFRYPVTATAVHFVIKYIFTRAWVSYSKIEIQPMSWGFQLRWAHGDTRAILIHLTMIRSTTIPIGIATVADVAFANMSMRYISVTMYTIVKAGALISWVFSSFCSSYSSCHIIIISLV